MKPWHEIHNLMDIKNIGIVAFSVFVCTNACADVTKLKTVAMVTDLVDDAGHTDFIDRMRQSRYEETLLSFARSGRLDLDKEVKVEYEAN